MQFHEPLLVILCCFRFLSTHHHVALPRSVATLSTVPRMPYLSVLVFKVAPLVPKSFAHWALYLPPEDGGNGVGRIYTVKKLGMTSRITQYSNHPFTLSSEVLYIPLQHIFVSQNRLHTICELVTNDPGRPSFSIFNHNCQQWVMDVVRKVEEQLGLVQRVDLTAVLRPYGYEPFNPR